MFFGQRLGYWVIPTRTEGMAAQQTLDSQATSFRRAKARDGFHRILAASGVETAGVRQ